MPQMTRADKMPKTAPSQKQSDRIPEATRAKLAKLLPRLASNFDGERVATLAAIDRILVGTGFDWNDLAAVLAAEPDDDAAPAADPDAIYMAAGALRELVDAIAMNDRGKISNRSRAFLAEMRKRARRGAPIRLTPKQAEWLRGLAQQTGVAA
jgi:hypothetical protein